MARIGKRILSAFIDVEEGVKQPPAQTGAPESPQVPVQTGTDERFTAYFDKLFSDANIAGPDYYEFSRMIGAMQAIADERARYAAAYAGLQAQGLDKERLLSTANEYLHTLTTDAKQFRKSVDNALGEKVRGRSAEMEEKSRRIQTLSQEILQLQQQVADLQKEIAGNNEKLEASSRGYSAESDRRRAWILADIDRINRYL
jgi:hypothetical protein